MKLPDPALQVVELLRLARLDDRLLSVTAMPGGRNNQVFRVETADKRVFLFKRYFHHPSDPRNRLRHEAAFLTHLANVGCSMVPRLLAQIDRDQIALFDFIRGTPPTLEMIDERAIDQACEFYRQANRDRGAARAQNIPDASEACFSLDEHLRIGQRRVDRLQTMLVHDDIDRAAAEFVCTELLPRWQQVRAEILADRAGPTLSSDVLPASARCLSPSDFGFHNSLRGDSGTLRFLDFEYAGWDDPAKLICDFANQPDMLLPRALSDRLRRAVVALDPQPEILDHRVEVLEPLYQIKWACICLNDFLPVGRSRQSFAVTDNPDASRSREAQLRRARQMHARAAGVTSRAPTPAPAHSNFN